MGNDLVYVSPSSELSASIAKFSAKFCNELPKDKSVVSSPLSAEFLLALLTLGAKEPTHTELLRALGIADDKASGTPDRCSVQYVAHHQERATEDASQPAVRGETRAGTRLLLTRIGSNTGRAFPTTNTIRSSFSSVSSRLKSLKGVTLNVANQVYVKEGPHELQAKLKEDAVKVFDAGIEKLNFGNSAAAAKTINNWVENKTNNKIKDLISGDSLSEDTRLVLVNALYFKGTWKTQFDPHHTRDQTFHVNKTKTIQVPMMYKEADFKYGESEALGAQLLEMPYVGAEASMVIVLPNEVEGLDGVLKKLAGGYDLLNDLAKMSSMKVQVSVPKFKIETEIDLNQLLPKLGISSIFDSGSGGLDNLLAPPEPLFVSKAVQKAFIEVNEEGAEAAAATGMVMMLRCAGPPSPRLRCDRPFLFALAGPDGSYLFTGIYRGDSVPV